MDEYPILRKRYAKQTYSDGISLQNWWDDTKKLISMVFHARMRIKQLEKELKDRL